MLLNFPSAEITGNLLIVPDKVITFEEDAENFDFPIARSMKLKSVMGYGTRHVAPSEVTVSDLVISGFNYLINNEKLDLQSIDALILVTQTPDHFVPQTSAIINKHLAFKDDILLLDITQGCAGFVVGLMNSLNWLDLHSSIKKIALVTADVLTRKISPKDRNSLPLAGDAAAITILEKTKNRSFWPSAINFDRSGADSLIIPAGAFRKPSNSETAILESSGDHNWRAQDHLCMDGSAVFNFVMTKVPEQINNLLFNANIDIKEIDYFFTHQPNKFMLNKLADKLGISRSKLPCSVTGKYGNSNSVTIPAIIADTLPSFTESTIKVCFSGFGVGLTWASIIATLGPMAFNEIYTYQLGEKK